MKRFNTIWTAMLAAGVTLSANANIVGQAQADARIYLNGQVQADKYIYPAPEALAVRWCLPVSPALLHATLSGITQQAADSSTILPPEDLLSRAVMTRCLSREAGGLTTCADKQTKQGADAAPQEKEQVIEKASPAAGTATGQETEKTPPQAEAQHDIADTSVGAVIAREKAALVEAKQQHLAAIGSDLTRQVNRAGAQLLAQMDMSNPVISGLGVAVLLDAVAAGATGASRAQIETWLGGGQPRESLAPVLKVENEALQQAAGLLIVDMAAVLPGYRQRLLSQGYVLASDLSALNQAVAGLTRGRIPRVLTALPPNTRLVLSHALHFAAPWQSAFDPEETDMQPFSALVGQRQKTVVVPMMHKTLPAVLLSEADYLGLALPFQGGYTLLLAMPTQAVANRAALTQAMQWLDSRRGVLLGSPGADAEVAVQLPKWSLTASHDLIAPLSRGGVRDIFSAQKAQLPGISRKDALYVGQFKQDITLNVDEYGGRASAATTAVLRTRGLRLSSPREAVINRPFAYAVVNRENGMNVLSGYMECPAACQDGKD